METWLKYVCVDVREAFLCFARSYSFLQVYENNFGVLVSLLYIKVVILILR